jgi:hypothetical protein
VVGGDDGCGVGVPGADRGAGAPALGHGRLCRRPGTPQALNGTAPPHAGGRRRSPGEREAARHTACGIRALGLATARRRLGGGGGGVVAVSRAGPPDAKKNGLTTRQSADGVRPPAPDAAGVAGLAAGRAPSETASAPPHPGLGMDAPPVPGVPETPGPLAATPPQGKRGDAADDRHGPASLVRCAAPWSGFRQAPARARRPPVDWARAVAQWLETRYGAGAPGTLGGENLHPPTTGAGSEAFPPERARASVKRLEVCDTPKHGRWWHVAAGACSGLRRPGLTDRRIGARPLLQAESGLWADKSNAKQRGVDWPCKIDAARTKWKRLYPKMKSG